ncbi:Uncharacterised protein [Mycobacterium tuberculosis]|nr:Uncharacterised protein [Mycobacterium tuberculosis]
MPIAAAWIEDDVGIAVLRQPNHRSQVVVGKADLLQVVLDDLLEDVLPGSRDNQPPDHQIIRTALPGPFSEPPEHLGTVRAQILGRKRVWPDILD